MLKSCLPKTIVEVLKLNSFSHLKSTDVNCWRDLTPKGDQVYVKLQGFVKLLFFNRPQPKKHMKPQERVSPCPPLIRAHFLTKQDKKSQTALGC